MLLCVTGRFQTPSVICSLCDLTDDPDPNIRAVAAIGLGKASESCNCFNSFSYYVNRKIL